MNIEITAQDAAKLMESGDVNIIDVRTPAEHAQGHIEGNQNIDFYDENFKSNVEKLDRSKTYVVYCASGGRSGKAVKMMQELGFSACYSLAGGFSGWAGQGMKVVA